MLPGPTANTVYVGGTFSTVNGVTSKGITLLNTTNGQIVSGFKPANMNGIVYSLGLAGGRVYIAGTFTTVGGVAHGGIATLNQSTGKLDPFMNVQLAGHHNYNGSRRQRRRRPPRHGNQPAGHARGRDRQLQDR